jgi:hypothetical protein
MIKYYPHKEIDLFKWDASIGNAKNGNIYAYSWYLNCCCEHWDALIEGDYENLMPLPYRKKMGISYVFPPSMTQQLGIFSGNVISEDKVTEFLEHIPSKFKYSELNLNHDNFIRDIANKITEHTNLELDLKHPYIELYSHFSENTVRNIKKAKRTDIRVWKNGEIQNILQLFKYSKSGEIKNLPEDYLQVVEKLGTELIKRGNAQLWEASVEGDLCAGIMFAFSHKKAYFLFSAANKKAKETGAISHLLNSFIHEYSGRKMVLDFEGSDNKNLARFYKSFGAIEKNYQKIIVSKLPDMLISLAKAIKKK